MRFWRTRRRRSMSEFDVMAKLLVGRDVDCVFDVGANDGRVALRLIETFRPERLFAFEPVGSNAAALRARLADHPGATVHEIAVGSEDGEVSFNINANSVYNNSLLRAAEGGGQWHDIRHVRTETVACVRIDTFCDTHGIAGIDILKVDAEGADLMVLQGAETMLREKRIGIVFVEVLFSAAFAGQGGLGAFLNLLEDRGYVLYGFFGQKIDDDGRLIRADALFVEGSLLG